MNLYPAWSFFDRFPVVVWPPALHKGQPKYAKPPEIVHPNACRSTERDGRCNPPNIAIPTWKSACHCCCLCSSCCLCCGCLLLHLPVTLAQVKHFGVGLRVNFMHSISRCSASF